MVFPLKTDSFSLCWGKLFFLGLLPAAASVSVKLYHSVLSSEFSGASLHLFRIWQPLTNHFFLRKEIKEKKKTKRTDPLPALPAAAFLFIRRRDEMGA